MPRCAASLVLVGIPGQKRTLVDKSRKNTFGCATVTAAMFTVIALSNYDIDVFTPIADPLQVGDP